MCIHHSDCPELCAKCEHNRTHPREYIKKQGYIGYFELPNYIKTGNTTRGLSQATEQALR